MTNIDRKQHDKYMLWAIFSLAFCGSVLHGARVWLLCGISVVTAKAVDVLASMILRKDYDPSDHSSEVAALIFMLMLPVNIPVYVIVISVAITIAVGKHMFGGADVYPFNLSALAMCCAAVNWPKEVFSAVVPFAKVDLLTGYTTKATISNASLIKDGGVPPYGLVDMVLGNYPGVMGADFVLVIVVISFFLIIRKKITWHIPLTFLVTCAAIAYAFPRIVGFSRFDSIAFEMLNGSVFFVALFMLSDPTTSPKTPKAKIIYGFMTAVFAMIFRYFGSFDIGTCFALLLMNTVDGYIERKVSGEKIKISDITAVEVVDDEKPAKPVRKLYTAPKPTKAEKAEAKKAAKVRKEKVKGPSDAMDLISEAEDNIDKVIYSTRQINIDEILRAEAEMNRKKGGKK